MFCNFNLTPLSYDFTIHLNKFFKMLSLENNFKKDGYASSKNSIDWKRQDNKYRFNFDGKIAKQKLCYPMYLNLRMIITCCLIKIILGMKDFKFQKLFTKNNV